MRGPIPEYQMKCIKKKSDRMVRDEPSKSLIDVFWNCTGPGS